MPNDPSHADRRLYPVRPIVGVGVIVWRGAEVLLIKRARPPRAGQWSLPGGAQTLGETIDDAARREVAEETGLTIGPTRLVTCVDLIDRDDAGAVRYHYTLVDLTADAGEGPPRPGDDAADARFFPPEALPGLGMWPLTLEVIEQARRMRDRA
ncbi:NUDIX hydrolase [Marinivivus vitaminiproducens]|uniref:NUDIX hydrolase n=1 Tax=Marinivivus vitaminiproducens TaxID=3035935 RepID=UPI0027A7F4AB|nr:NUDIX hydrolase [Geminicoccaceae bacterium SCSIO 64248]